MGRHDFTPGYDQAHRLRCLMARGVSKATDAQTHVLSVVSGKGGVGKTMIAANLSIALAARGHRVILFDMDMGLANTDIMLGVEPQCTWSEVLSGRRRVDDVIIDVPGNVAFVPGASGLTELANLSDFERHQLMAAMRQIECEYDIVVMDCGAGIGRNVIEFAASADTVLIITTPEPTSITDAYATIKTLVRDRSRSQEPDVPVQSQGLIVNLAESRREGRSTYERLAGVAARFLHLPIIDYGYVLRDEHVTAAVRQRCPVLLRYPRAPASTCLMASAGKLARELGQPEVQKSLFYRVMNMFL